MATVTGFIDGVVVGKEVVEPKSIWSSIKGLASESSKYAAKVSKDAYAYTSKVTTEKVVPVVKSGVVSAAKGADVGVDWTLKHAGSGLGVVFDYVGTKLEANPNIAKALSPTTVLRAYAYAAVEKDANRGNAVVNITAQQ